MTASVPVQRFETSVGADGTQHSLSIYSAMTAALGGSIRHDGFRLRAGGGYGTYAYTSPRWNGAARVPQAFDGTQSYADVMLGGQVTIGPWIVKAFAGVSREEHKITPFDDENAVQGGKTGAKFAIETWLPFGQTAYLQTDASWSQMFEAYSGRARLGYRVTPTLSFGAEAAAMGNVTYDAGRAGLFARYEWGGGEVSISGGGAGDMSGVTGAYGSLSVLIRY